MEVTLIGRTGLCLVLALVGCDSRQTLTVDKGNENSTIQQSSVGSTHTFKAENVSGPVSAENYDGGTASSAKVTIGENVTGNISTKQTNSGWGNSQSITIGGSTR